MIDCSVTSELLMCNTGPAAAAVPSSTTSSLSAGIVRRSLTPATSAGPYSPGASRHHVVRVVIDGYTVSSDSATFTYVDDPVITDVIERDSILRSVESTVYS